MNAGLHYLRYLVWLIVPVTVLAIYLIFGLPHLIWSYEWRPTGPSSYTDFSARHYTRCTFWGPYGRFTEYPDNGTCGWVRFAKKRGSGS